MATMKLPFVIFYAWQSDSPGNGNHHLIREALERAKDKLNADTSSKYDIQITSDTQDEPGMCDIPATILSKIDSADAAVLDLTFVAKTDNAEKPKHCPNPNVLFELGYAFKSIKPERLVLVMNENFGPASETLFDINHRRYPIRYTFPDEGKTRNQVIKELSDRLVAAISVIAKRKLQAAAGANSGEMFKQETASIKEHWATTAKFSATPHVIFSFHPTLFDKARWTDYLAVENALRQHRTRSLSNGLPYPPSNENDERLPSGIYNGTFPRQSWSLCHSAQFWIALDVAGDTDIKTNQLLVSGTSKAQKVIAAKGTWVDYAYAVLLLANAFRFAAYVSKSFDGDEGITWHAEAINIKGTVLSYGASLESLSKPCAAVNAELSQTTTAKDFRNHWNEACADFCARFLGYYKVEGTYIVKPTIQARLDQLTQPFKADDIFLSE